MHHSGIENLSQNYQLDLHGETREKAVSKLISFLDQIRHNHSTESSSTSVMVTIVTGSGSHSSTGPVLRPAIEKVLKKRQMKYHLTHRKGAFVVDALSGIELYEEAVVDTKINFVPDEEFRAVNTCNKNKANALPYAYRKHQQNDITLDCTDENDEASNIKSGHNPLPQEVAADDDNIAKAKELSLKEASVELSRKTKEKNELNQALALSIETLKFEEEVDVQEMDEMMMRVLRLSQECAKKEQEILEKELQDTLELSKRETILNSQLEDEAIKYAISLSKEETYIAQTMTSKKDDNTNGN